MYRIGLSLRVWQVSAIFGNRCGVHRPLTPSPESVKKIRYRRGRAPSRSLMGGDPFEISVR